MASPDRFLARTESGPLPEGLCGGPVIQLTSVTSITIHIRGVVEGIVPLDNQSQELAGLASFLPSYRVREFVDFAERIMLEQIIDNDLFRKVVDLKQKKGQRGTTYRTEPEGGIHVDNDDHEDDDVLPDDPNLRASIEGTNAEVDTPQIDHEYQTIIAGLRKNHTPEEVDAILATVEREREEVIKLMETEGGDLDDVIEAVRRKTYIEKSQILEEIEKEMIAKSNERRSVSSKEEDT